jgi:hypothetical protein
VLDVVHWDEPPPQVVVATFPAIFTLRHGVPEEPRPMIVRFVVVALPLRTSPPNVGALAVAML